MKGTDGNYYFISMFADGFKGRLAKAEILRTSPADGWLYRGKRLVVTERDLERIVANWKAYPRDIPLDYEHGSGLDGPVGSAIAAGWLRDLELERHADGSGAVLWGTFELTQRAAEWVAGGEYRLTSSEFVLDYIHPAVGKPIGMYLCAVGLTNRPFIDGLQPMTMMSEAAALFIEHHRTTEQTNTERVHSKYLTKETTTPEGRS
jgi:phage I-like protein